MSAAQTLQFIRPHHGWVSGTIGKPELCKGELVGVIAFEGFDKLDDVKRAVEAQPAQLAALRHSRQFIIAWQMDYIQKPRTKHNEDQLGLIAKALVQIDAAIAGAP